LKRGKTTWLAGLEDLREDAIVISPYVVGSVMPQRETPSTPWEVLGLRAVESLEKYAGFSFDAVVPIEIGGYNTAVAACVAAEKDIPLLDADPVGRSVPGVEQTSYCLHGLPIVPMALVTGMGDVVVVREAADDFRAEMIARALASVSGGAIGVADHPLTAAALSSSLTPGSLTRALTIGSTIRGASEQGSDPVEAIINTCGGYLLFVGVVQDAQWQEENGFTMGELRIEGIHGARTGSYLVQYKNEHYAAWLDSEVDITAPDLICVLDTRTGDAIPNPDCREGMEVSVVGFAAPAVWRTAEGLKLLGPQAFGLDAEYVAIEQRRGSLH